MQVGTLVYDDHYGIGIVIAIEREGLLVEFPEVGKQGIVDFSDRTLEVICK